MCRWEVRKDPEAPDQFPAPFPKSTVHLSLPWGGREDGEAEGWECIWEDKHSCWWILSIELDYHFRNDCNAWKTLKLEDNRITSYFNPPPSRQSNGVLQVRQEAIYKRERATLTAPVSLQGQVDSEHLFNDGKSVNFSTLDVWEAKLTQVWTSLAVFISIEHFYSLDRIDNQWFMISELKLCCFPYDCDMICFLVLQDPKEVSHY